MLKNNLPTKEIDGKIVHELEAIDDKMGGLKLKCMFKP